MPITAAGLCSSVGRRNTSRGSARDVWHWKARHQAGVKWRRCCQHPGCGWTTAAVVAAGKECFRIGAASGQQMQTGLPISAPGPTAACWPLTQASRRYSALICPWRPGYLRCRSTTLLPIACSIAVRQPQSCAPCALLMQSAQHKDCRYDDGKGKGAREKPVEREVMVAGVFWQDMRSESRLCTEHYLSFLRGQQRRWVTMRSHHAPSLLVLQAPQLCVLLAWRVRTRIQGGGQQHSVLYVSSPCLPGASSLAPKRGRPRAAAPPPRPTHWQAGRPVPSSPHSHAPSSARVWPKRAPVLFWANF